jgi:hypothetical protein
MMSETSQICRVTIEYSNLFPFQAFFVVLTQLALRIDRR